MKETAEIYPLDFFGEHINEINIKQNKNFLLWIIQN